MGVGFQPSEPVEPPAPWLGLLHQLPFLPAPPSLPLSLREILAMPVFCRSRGSALELESSVQLSPRRMVLCTGRRAPGTTRGSVSTATSGTMARLTLSSTPLVLMASESLEVTTSPAEDKPLHRPTI